MTLLDRSLREQAAAIAARDADAGELLDEALARIEDRNPELNAIVATFPEDSRRMLDGAPAGPLHGVPVVVKDEWPLPWRAERLGTAQLLVPTHPGESGPYRALRDAGAVIAGVANMHEYGAGSTGHVSAYGPARNPWDTDRCPGGSSSGSGAAVAARIVAGAVGADGVGSIRYPAAYCGVTGLKPTFGRSAMEGHHVRDTTTIVSGPLCPDAADCRLLAGALFGEPLSAGDADGIRIGIVPGAPWDDCQPGVRAACERALAGLREATGGGEVREVAIGGLEHVLISSILIGQTEELPSLSPARVNGLSEDVSLIARALMKYRLLVPAAAVARAQRIRNQTRRSLAAAFEHVDVIAWPTVPAVAPPLDNTTVELPSGTYPADYANPRFGGLANLTGLPAISMPVGRDGDGLPIGLQLHAAWGRDGLLLDAAEALERATDRRHVDAVPKSHRTEIPAP
ncbi:MAG TPA: amidase [Solirubrobacterales bacterium]|nr:amidase [Solirubrobacterales bacterium]